VAYHVDTTDIPGVLVLVPRVFEDERGFFFESFNQRDFNAAIGSTDFTFVQDNHSHSVRGTLRGLHFQSPNPQGKLVRVTSGTVFDVVVDIRLGSSTFGKWYGIELSADNKKQLWIPPGLAHGFLTVSGEAQFQYKTTDYYAPQSERTLLWNDETLGIEWPGKRETFLLSQKDRQGVPFTDIGNLNILIR
jgi:dTDP-4-dehydrorhamnose 3,5-epimerase